MITAEQMKAIGGREWTNPNGGELRIYLSDWPPFAGLDIDRYKTGNIRYADLDGERISNSQAAKFILGKVWWEDGKLCGKGVHEEMWPKVIDGIRAAVAALEVAE